ncbi:MAG: hypothetical protein Q9187_001946, partial [Circinaria calcarea]
MGDICPSISPPVVRSGHHHPTKPRSKTQTIHRRSQHGPVFSTSFSPTHVLISALKESGHHSAIPEKTRNKVDLSIVSPFSTKRQRRASLQRQLMSSTTPKSQRNHEISLQWILAQYIRRVDPILDPDSLKNADIYDNRQLDHTLLHVFNTATLNFLRSKGFESSDVVTWAWIITAKTSQQAALRLLMISNSTLGKNTLSSNPVPTFVFLFLLRRRHMTAHALRYLIVHAWERLRNRCYPRWTSIVKEKLPQNLTFDAWFDKGWKSLTKYETHYLEMSEPTMVTMIVRLLRHARKVWPAAIISIAKMLTNHLDSSGRDHELNTNVSRRLSLLYNRALSLLALPSQQHPLRSIPYHQRAQFNVLRRMNEFKPALIVNREGYRAVIRVQAAHRKTLREFEWADLKAKSWPPWKEEKLGLDVDKGVELGISRATGSMSRLKEAGYRACAWENTANIYAGWDTDRSPTIQTRVVLPLYLETRKDQTPSQPKLNNLGKNDEVGGIWAARIRSTRTLNEAWACFLSYEDHKPPPTIEVYFAMFEKIFFENKRCRDKSKVAGDDRIDNLTISSRPMPGDGKEVVMPSISPRNLTYTRTQPPSLARLFDQMIADGIKPSGRCLAFLIKHADSFGTGLKYLRLSSLPGNVVQLLSGHQVPDSFESHETLQTLPDYLFGAHITFLSRFGSWDSQRGRQPIPRLGYGGNVQLMYNRITSNHQSTRKNPLLIALRLMLACKPYYRPPWYSLLAAFTHSRRSDSSLVCGHDADVDDMLSWKLAVELINHMDEIELDLDFEGFQIICVNLEKTIRACHGILAQMTRRPVLITDICYERETAVNTLGDTRRQLKFQAEEVLVEGPNRVKAIFKRLVSGQSQDVQHDNGEGFFKGSLSQQDTINPALLLPTLLEIPGPAQLHAFIRVLGLSKDYIGIQGIVKWMAHFDKELKSVADELSNGSTMMRRSLIAIRVFLERSWTYYGVAEDDEKDGLAQIVDEETSEAVLQKVYEIIESVEGWGGWPTDDEVEAYCRN